MTYNFGEVFPYLLKNSDGDISLNYSLFKDDDNIDELEYFFYEMTKYGFDGCIIIPAFTYRHKDGEEKKFPEMEFNLTVLESDEIFDTAYEGKTFLRYEGIIYDEDNEKHFKFSSKHLKSLDNHVTSMSVWEFTPKPKEEPEDQGIFFIVKKENDNTSIHGMFDSLENALIYVPSVKVEQSKNITIEKMPFNNIIINNDNNDFNSFFENSLKSYDQKGKEIKDESKNSLKK